MKIEIVVTVLRYATMAMLLAISLASGVMAYLKGKSNRHLTKALSQAEQRDDLRSYMIEEIEGAESTSKMFQITDTAEWKKATVLKNVTLYAKGQGYSWYDKEEWSTKIDDYVKGTKKVNFTQVQLTEQKK